MPVPFPSLSRHLKHLRPILQHRQQRRQRIRIPQHLRDILAHPPQPLLQGLVPRLARRVLPHDLPPPVLDVHARVAQPHDDAVQPQEEARQQQQPLGHDADFHAEQADAVVRELVLVQVDRVEEEDRVRAGEEVGADGVAALVCELPTFLAGCFAVRRRRRRRPLVIRAVAPIERPHDPLRARAHALAVLLPRVRDGHLQHSLLGLRDAVERVFGVEGQFPAGRDVLDRDEVVAEDHLGDRDADARGEGFDRVRFEDGLLAGEDAPGVVGRCEGLRAGVGAGGGGVGGGREAAVGSRHGGWVVPGSVFWCLSTKMVVAGA